MLSRIRFGIFPTIIAFLTHRKTPPLEDRQISKEMNNKGVKQMIFFKNLFCILINSELSI
jgi:hypothetical protein